MKLVINRCYGGFGISEWGMEKLGIEFSDEISRADMRLIELVEKSPEKVSKMYAKLKVIELPDEMTDFEIIEEDGFEEVIYVVNGKIHHY